MKRNLGGRGQRAEYSTSVIRVPDPIKDEVLRLVNEFHDKREGKAIASTIPSKPETKRYWQLPASVICKWVQSIEPIEGETDPPAGDCFGLNKDCWFVDDGVK